MTREALEVVKTHLAVSGEEEPLMSNLAQYLGGRLRSRIPPKQLSILKWIAGSYGMHDEFCAWGKWHRQCGRPLCGRPGAVSEWTAVLRSYRDRKLGAGFLRGWDCNGELGTLQSIGWRWGGVDRHMFLFLSRRLLLSLGRDCVFLEGLSSCNVRWVFLVLTPKNCAKYWRGVKNSQPPTTHSPAYAFLCCAGLGNMGLQSDSDCGEGLDRAELHARVQHRNGNNALSGPGECDGYVFYSILKKRASPCNRCPFCPHESRPQCVCRNSCPLVLYYLMISLLGVSNYPHPVNGDSEKNRQTYIIFRIWCLTWGSENLFMLCICRNAGILHPLPDWLSGCCRHSGEWHRECAVEGVREDRAELAHHRSLCCPHCCTLAARAEADRPVILV